MKAHEAQFLIDHNLKWLPGTEWLTLEAGAALSSIPVATLRRYIDELDVPTLNPSQTARG